jgi:hypothetical protein
MRREALSVRAADVCRMMYVQQLLRLGKSLLLTVMTQTDVVHMHEQITVPNELRG